MPLIDNVLSLMYIYGEYEKMFEFEKILLTMKGLNPPPK